MCHYEKGLENEVPHVENMGNFILHTIGSVYAKYQLYNFFLQNTYHARTIDPRKR